MPPLLSIENLSIGFGRGDNVVEGVSFDVQKGETLALVGESGSGKTVTCRAVLRILPRIAKIRSGRITFGGREGPVELSSIRERQMREIRGNEISMIFQEPMRSLSPLHRIGNQVGEVLRLHRGAARGDAKTQVLETFERVGFPDPERAFRAYPFEMSGGMRQRAMIAMAMVAKPDLLIADEPTTALDVTVQAQILDLMGDLRSRTGAAVMLVTHDLGVVAQTCDDVVVMYAGRVVERAGTAALFADPQHPYTVGLMAAIPRINTAVGRLATIPGSVPPPWAALSGCRFASRCPLATDQCRAEDPPMTEISAGHAVACWRAPIEVAA